MNEKKSNKSKKTKKSNSLKILYLIIALAVIVVLGTLAAVLITRQNNPIALEYEYSDGFEPGSSFQIKLTKDRKLHLSRYHASSLPNGEGAGTDDYDIELTEDEYDKVLAYAEANGTKANTTSVLFILSLDNDVNCTRRDDWCDLSMDTNGDGSVSSREYGRYLLDHPENDDI